MHSGALYLKFVISSCVLFTVVMPTAKMSGLPLRKYSLAVWINAHYCLNSGTFKCKSIIFGARIFTKCSFKSISKYLNQTFSLSIGGFQIFLGDTKRKGTNRDILFAV